MSRLRMAVVGVGALGRHHARILSSLDCVDLVAVSETNAELGRATADEHATEWVADYHDLFGRVDAVSIVIPTVAHAAVTSEFLMQRIPVLVEKPITNELASAERLVDLAKANDTLLQVGHIERFNPAMVAARPLCEDAKYIRAERISPFAFRSTDIGVVHDLMIHDIDLVLDMVQSPLIRCEAFGVSVMGDLDDIAQARLVFANGCIADLTASRLSPIANRAMQVWSRNGCVSIDFNSKSVQRLSPSAKLLFGTSPVQRAAAPGADIEQLKQDVFTSFIEPHDVDVVDCDALTAELLSFADAVANNSAPAVSGKEAVDAMRVADQVLQSLATHQWDGRADGAIGPKTLHQTGRRQAG